MIALAGAAGAAVVPLGAALIAKRAASARAARRVASAGMLVAFASALAASVATGGGERASVPVLIAAIGLVAVVMSPLGGATPRTFARILLVVGGTAAIVVTDVPVALALGWIGSIVPAWLELRSRRETRPSARAFAAYLVPSAALVTLGALLASTGLPPAYGLLALAAGLAIREAILPAHGWLPRFVEQAPMGLVVAFVAPQIGVFAHLRWLAGRLAPEVDLVLAVLAALTVVSAALLAVVQRRARRALGYFFVSQSALVAFGLDGDDVVGRSGAVLAWWTCGLATAGFAMTLAALEARRGALSLEHAGRSARQVPLLATAYVVLGLASVGLPGTLGFIAEDLLVSGAVHEHPVLAFALVVGTALNGITVARGFFTLFAGARAPVGERDLTLRERSVLTALVAALLVAGVWPSGPVRWLGLAEPPPAAASTR
ncbi:MAG: hypothetical protein KF729_15720 [Sandaracinaceae bacterium]|nr:hypothetical protein [Sandaracinaceae bacterium]